MKLTLLRIVNDVNLNPTEESPKSLVELEVEGRVRIDYLREIITLMIPFLIGVTLLGGLLVPFRQQGHHRQQGGQSQSQGFR